MRDAITDTGIERAYQTAHPGLYFTRMAPIPAAVGESLDPERKERVIERVCSIAVPDFYEGAYQRWRQGLQRRAFTWELELTSRLLVGHGEPSTIGKGITLHPTYGVPYIPGSAIKGVLSHYLGTRDDQWRGVIYRDEDDNDRPLGDGRPFGAPGTWSRIVFGAPPTDDAPQGDARGYVELEDAWLVPGQSEVLVPDVLTPHQSKYYRETSPEPIDWDDPIPVGFITARPGLRFLFGVSCDPDVEPWAELAIKHLADALRIRGIGGKSSIYGRFRALPDALTPRAPTRNAPVAVATPVLAANAPRSEALLAFERAVDAVDNTTENKVPTFVAQGFAALAEAIPAPERATALALFRPLAKHSKIARREPELVSQVLGLLGG